jgi:uncharacterized membrane protein HdeD (DUF308 family)
LRVALAQDDRRGRAPFAAAEGSSMDRMNDRTSAWRPRASHAASWHGAWGALLILSGVLAVAMSFVAAFATALLFAWLLIVGGIGEVAYAIQTRHERGFGWKFVGGVLTLALGILVLLAPLAGAASLGLMVGAFLLMGGIARTVLAFTLRPAHGWGWVLADGLLSIAIAVLIAAGWPGASVGFIGVLTGLWLIWAGLWRLLRRADAAAA